MDTNQPKKKILIVEDESALLFALKAELSYAGYDVEVASDGEEGLDKIEKLKPALVILDLLLPKKDGFTVLEEMKRKNLLQDSPVIVVSNLGESKNIERCKALGVDDYLVKTENSLEAIVGRVKKVLEKNND